MRSSDTSAKSFAVAAEAAERSALDRFLSRPVPVWLVVAMVMLFALATVAFGWYVKRSLYLSDGHPVARAALAIASFPTDARKAFQEVGRQLSGEADYKYVRASAGPEDFVGFSPAKSRLETTIDGLLVRHGDGTPARGWRVLVGAFEIGGSIEDAAVLFSPDLEIVRYWLLAEGGPTNADPEPPSADLTHGFTMLHDGSVIYNSETGGGLRKLDSCGRPVWSALGHYHHAVTEDDTQTTVWTLRTDSEPDLAAASKIVQHAVADGKVLREISIADIIAANPNIDILELRRQHENKPTENARGQPGRWLTDPFHLNDVDPLPEDLASRFPMFSAGDLAISARELNLVFVIDPATLAIKWWRVGATIRQHDPDWTDSGRLSVFNNRMARDYSSIVEIDPATLAKTVTVNGGDIDFYARAGGKHQPMPGGGMMIAGPWSGRVIEVAPSGDVALEFYSVLTEERIAAVITEALFLPEEALDIGALQCGEP
jgi:hypothetical protein